MIILPSRVDGSGVFAVLALGDRPMGVFLALISALMAGAAHSLSAIPGQAVYVWTTGGMALAAGLLAVEFLMKCPTLSRIAGRIHQS